MRTKGRITSWNDAKGYGFITPLAGGERTFMHIKALANRARRPAVGDIVTYTLSADARGRPRADAAVIAGVAHAARPNRRPGTLPQLAAVAFLVLVAGAAAVSAVPLPVLAIYVAVSVITIAAYALDKMAAKQGDWRTSESTLHLLALAGGWPGALIAQGRLRHKTRKQPFRAIFWVTVILNCAAFVWLLTPDGASAWRSIASAVT
ncbi:MAG: cold shock and DUF1294 domain-containing protein [Gammaproteobacteria bacterium]|nr:cold shock and DUF1294 domain-containing protein [Gammaproteobacteria bacterium]